jgi:flagellar basal-body rod modification protein FlgD
MSVDLNTLKSLGLTQSASKTTGATKQLGQDTFLKLMTAQLNNQNPLKPQDNAQFLTQMAQFSTVSGIQDLQDSVKSLASSLQQDQSVSASQLVGHTASVASGKAMLPASGSMSGYLNLPSDASNVILRISDTNGKLMKVESLGAQSQGQVPFQWDGAPDGGGAVATPGLYQIKAEAVIGGETVALETQSSAAVKSVTLGGTQGLEVELEGLGRFPLSEIQAVH